MSPFPLFLFCISLLTASLARRLIFLPAPSIPEGVTHHAGSLFFTADVLTGRVFLIDSVTSTVATIIVPPPNTLAGGLASNGDTLLFVAGGGPMLATISPFFPNVTASLNVFDIPTGDQIASCPIPRGRLVNDVTVAGNAAYFTDSGRRFIYRLNIDTLPDCQVGFIPLPRNIFAGNGFRANGIVMFNKGLLVSHSELNTIFFIDLRLDNIVTRVLPVGSVQGVDGLELVRRNGEVLLFVAQNVLNLVSVFRLSFNAEMRTVGAERLGRIRRSFFAFPTTVAVNRDTLVVANFNMSSMGEGGSVATVGLGSALQL